MTTPDDLPDFEQNQSTDEGFFAKFGIVAAWIIGISGVVVGSLSILIALALPAIQQSRETARRAQSHRCVGTARSNVGILLGHPCVLQNYSARSFRSAVQFGRPSFHFTATPATSEAVISDRENGRAVASRSDR